MALVRPFSPLLFPALVTEASSDVTMFQRSSTYIMSVKHGVTAVFGSSFQIFYELHVAIEFCENRFILRRRTTSRYCGSY
jgi:hypothetical protein